jgi:hypothetical protein
MDTFTIFAIVVTLVLIGLILWNMFGKSTVSDPTAVVLVDGSISGKTGRSYTNPIPRSFNQSEGATFTYAGWLLMNDFTMNYGQKRVIFSKNDCPGLYLDSTSNSLLVVVDTYGSKESILISNIPARKWIHFGIVVDQDSVDIYINGVIRQHHMLAQLPKQNDSPITIGSDSLGWDGALSGLTYYTRSLTASDIDGLSKTVPKDDLHVSPAGPQYFDMTWYTGRT